MPASKEELAEAEEEGVKVMYLVAPKEIAVEGGRVSAITMVNHVLGREDDSARRRPEPVDGAQFELSIDTVIWATGQAVDVGAEKGVLTTNWGTIAIDQQQRTNSPEVYAGGDAVLGASTVIEAIASGRNGAAAIDKALAGSEATIKPLSETQQVDVESVLARTGGGGRKWRVPVLVSDPDARRLTFEPTVGTLSDKQAREEASRCYRCGCGEGCMICHDICKMFAYHTDGVFVELDPDKCVGCGMCVWRCPNGNISMERTSAVPI